jgi:hypothetical protein
LNGTGMRLAGVRERFGRKLVRANTTEHSTVSTICQMISCGFISVGVELILWTLPRPRGGQRGEERRGESKHVSGTVVPIRNVATSI